MSFTLHVLCWSHLDREWNFPFETTRADMVGLLDELLDLLERRSDFSYFHLDGQVIPLEDYLEFRPENRARIERLVRAGRLLIGPWYTLPEMNVILGECIVRNLLRGRQAAAPFGGVMKVGLTNTSWGQVSQMPQILRNFGLDTYLSYRGVPVHRIEKECLWEGPDGSQVLLFRPTRGARSIFFIHVTVPATVFLRRSQADRENPPPVPPAARIAGSDSAVLEPYFGEQDPERIRTEHIGRAMTEIRETLAGDATTRHLGLGNWDDRTRMHPRLPDLVAEAARHVPPGDTLRISSLPAYIAAVKRDRRAVTVQVRGEMRCPQKGKMGAELLNVLATRTYIKIANRRAERALIYGAEPWATLASLFGFSYPQAELDWAWKLLLQNHCHDTIGGCGVDRVHQDQMNRFARIVDLAHDIKRRALIHLVRQAGFHPKQEGESLLAVFNVLPYARGGVVECALDVPQYMAARSLRVITASGREVPCEILSFTDETTKVYVPFRCYRVWTIRRFRVRLAFDAIPGIGCATFHVVPSPRVFVSGPHMRSGRNWMDNGRLRVVFHRNGTFSIQDRVSGGSWRGLGAFEDTGDVGHGWGHRAPHKDCRYLSTAGRVSVRRWEHGPLQTTFRVTVFLRVPESATADRTARSNRLRTLKIISDVSLRRESPCVHVRTWLDNTIRDHRLRVLFPTAAGVTRTCAETPFDVVARRVGRLSTSGWTEQDDGGRPMLNFVDASDGRRGLAVIVRGLCEYEAIRDAQRTLAVTLLRSFAFRRSREDMTPSHELAGTQCQGSHVFQYALYPHVGDWDAGGVASIAYGENVPLELVQSFGGNDAPPLDRTFVGISGGAMVLSALKRAEDGRGIILRVFNPTSRPLSANVTFSFPVRRVYRATMAEEDRRRVPLVAKNQTRIRLKRKQVVTVRIIPTGHRGGKNIHSGLRRPSR